MNDTAASPPATNESPLGTVKGLVEEHPVAMLAGGIMLGALIAGAMARPAKNQGEGKTKTRSGHSFGQRAVQIATIGAELAAAYVAGAESKMAHSSEFAPSSAPPPTATATEPQAAKSPAGRISNLASTALRTLGPVLSRRLGRKTPN